MTSKLKLLASVAIASASLASAQGAAAGNYYLNVSGGANWLQDESFRNISGANDTNTFWIDNDTKVGFVLSGAVGLHLDNVANGLRAEGEFAYRENEVGGSWSSTSVHGHSSDILDYQHSTFSIMANAWYDIAAVSTQGFTPFVGGGVGWANSRLSGTSIRRDIEESDGGFAWQLGAGVNLDIGDNMKFGIAYRYFVGPDVSIPAPDTRNPTSGDVSDKNDSVTVGFTFGL